MNLEKHEDIFKKTRWILCLWEKKKEADTQDLTHFKHFTLRESICRYIYTSERDRERERWRERESMRAENLETYERFGIFDHVKCGKELVRW